MQYLIKISIIAIAFLTSFAGYLLYEGYICLNGSESAKFPIIGIDVSAYQGNIAWDDVKDTGIKFVYIKATEGKDYQDGNFSENWENAKRVDIYRGAYHFFTFGSTGMEQVENFINVVPNEENCLPPVIDIEFGGNSKKIPSRDVLQKELRDFILQIDNNYKRKPILYVTYESYEKYIMGDFENYTIWIRDIIRFPKIKDNRAWSFWQYNNRGRVKGVSGFIDLNVFNGNKEEFEKLVSKN